MQALKGVQRKCLQDVIRDEKHWLTKVEKTLICWMIRTLAKRFKKWHENAIFSKKILCSVTRVLRRRRNRVLDPCFVSWMCHSRKRRILDVTFLRAAHKSLRGLLMVSFQSWAYFVDHAHRVHHSLSLSMPGDFACDSKAAQKFYSALTMQICSSLDIPEKAVSLFKHEQGSKTVEVVLSDIENEYGSHSSRTLAKKLSKACLDGKNYFAMCGLRCCATSAVLNGPVSQAFLNLVKKHYADPGAVNHLLQHALNKMDQASRIKCLRVQWKALREFVESRLSTRYRMWLIKQRVSRLDMSKCLHMWANYVGARRSIRVIRSLASNAAHKRLRNSMAKMWSRWAAASRTGQMSRHTQCQQKVSVFQTFVLGLEAQRVDMERKKNAMHYAVVCLLLGRFKAWVCWLRECKAVRRAAVLASTRAQANNRVRRLRDAWLLWDLSAKDHRPTVLAESPQYSTQPVNIHYSAEQVASVNIPRNGASQHVEGPRLPPRPTPYPSTEEASRFHTVFISRRQAFN